MTKTISARLSAYAGLAIRGLSLSSFGSRRGGQGGRRPGACSAAEKGRRLPATPSPGVAAL